MLDSYNHPNLQKLEDLVISQLEEARITQDIIDDIRIDGVEEFLNLDNPIRLSWVRAWNEDKVNEMVKEYVNQIKSNLKEDINMDQQTNYKELFVTKAREVEAWYTEWEEDQEKVEEIIGPSYWDGGDDIDYINSCILGFQEYGAPCKNDGEYILNFITCGYLTDNSSHEWVKKITELGYLFNQLTDEEIDSLYEEFEIPRDEEEDK